MVEVTVQQVGATLYNIYTNGKYFCISTFCVDFCIITKLKIFANAEETVQKNQKGIPNCACAGTVMPTLLLHVEFTIDTRGT